VSVSALQQPQAKNKIVEIVAKPEAASRSWEELFAQV
jgi:hypothetical protein